MQPARGRPLRGRRLQAHSPVATDFRFHAWRNQTAAMFRPVRRARHLINPKPRSTTETEPFFHGRYPGVEMLFAAHTALTADRGVEFVPPAGFANDWLVLISGQPAIGHSGDLVNGRRFFAAPLSPARRRYFDRFDRLLDDSSQTIDFASTFVP